MPRKRGVYFSANDNILELVIAFLNSFRRHNQTIPLCLIPYDDNFQQLEPLQSHYGFSIWNDPEILRQCDDISLSFHDYPLGHYRRLAIWEGEYDEFIYIDSDTVVLKNIDFTFDYLDEFSFLVSISNMPRSQRRWVWKESIYETDKLTPQQIDFSANMGFIASKKGCLGLHDIASRLPAAIELAIHMEPAGEQPLLNYLIVTSGMPYTSLRVIRMTTDDPDIPRELWGGTRTPGIIVQDGHVVCPEFPPIFLVHWAGPVKPTEKENQSFPLYGLWEFYRRMSLDFHRK